jgi:hypothetical protein
LLDNSGSLPNGDDRENCRRTHLLANIDSWEKYSERSAKRNDATSVAALVPTFFETSAFCHLRQGIVSVLLEGPLLSRIKLLSAQSDMALQRAAVRGIKFLTTRRRLASQGGRGFLDRTTIIALDSEQIMATSVANASICSRRKSQPVVDY